MTGTVMSNSVCLFVCLLMAVAQPTDKINMPYGIWNMLFLSGMMMHIDFGLVWFEEKKKMTYPVTLTYLA